MMSSAPIDNSEVPSVENETEDASRRGFIRAAVTAGVASVAGLTLGEAAVADDEAPKERKIAQSQGALKISGPPVTAEEKSKDQKRLQAEALLKQLGGDIQIQWVKGRLPAARRIIQMEG